MADVHCQDGEHNGRAGRNIEPCTNQTHTKAFLFFRRRILFWSP